MKPDIELLKHEFVEFIPDELEARTLYISTTHATAVHSCFCGCGREVVTPLSPTGWQLTFDGKSVSLDPSVGNWSLPCQSHYFIRKNRVVWAPRWTQRQIARGRASESRARDMYYQVQSQEETSLVDAASKNSNPLGAVWKRVKKSVARRKERDAPHRSRPQQCTPAGAEEIPL